MAEDASIFPGTPRVVYELNPLFEVICQLRFPTILRIETEPPAEFQDRVRRQYPTLREKRGPDHLPSNLPPKLAEIVASMVAKELALPTSYDFVSSDQKWTIGLTKDFVALSTTKYERWEAFRDRLSEVLAAVEAVYQPAFCTRVGLRYRNAIRKSVIENEDVGWDALLKPHVLGPLAEAATVAHVDEFHANTIIRLPCGGRVRIQHGLGTDEAKNEPVFVIDSDFSSDSRTELTDVLDRLDTFNHESGRLFRWCITERLHGAMRPRDAP